MSAAASVRSDHWGKMPCGRWSAPDRSPAILRSGVKDCPAGRQPERFPASSDPRPPAERRARSRQHHGLRIGLRYWAAAAILLLAISALLALLPRTQRDRARHPFASAPASNLQQELTQAADGVNASTPRMIDDMTRLDGAQAGPGTLFTYDYTLTNISASQLSPPSLRTLQQRLSADVRQTVCEGAALQPLLHMGAVIRFHYRDRDGQDLVLTSVSSAECTNERRSLSTTASLARATATSTGR